MTHTERMTDVPEGAVARLLSALEQRGAIVQTTAQPDGLFTLNATYPPASDGLTGLGAVGLVVNSSATPPSTATGISTDSSSVQNLTSTQAQTAKAIVNIFETGCVLGRYDQVTLIEGDTGHLTYGRSQTTLASGLLHDLLALYVSNTGARFAHHVTPYLEPTQRRDLSLDKDPKFANLLRACADDKVMRDTQDAFFDAAFFRPALTDARALGLQLPLSVAVVYDSRVHGSWRRLRDETTAQDGSVQKLGEKAWVQAYVRRRSQWLLQARQDLRPTVYRMEAFQHLIDQDCWGLALPIVLRGCEISSQSLAAEPPGCYDSPAPGSRPLSLCSPLARGLDVRLLQLALSNAGANITADGVLGGQSINALKRVQSDRGWSPTGVADIIQIAALVQSVMG